MDQFYVDAGYVDDNYFTYIADANVQLVSDYNISGSNNRVRSSSVQYTSNFTISIYPEYGNVISVLLLSDYQLSNTPTVNRSTTIALDTIVTLSLQAGKIVDVPVNLSANYTFNANITLKVDLKSTNTINIVPEIARDNTIQLLSDYTSTIDNIRLRSTTDILPSDYTINITNNVEKNVSVHYVSSYSSNITSNRLRDTNIPFVSNYTLLSIAGKPVIKYVYIIPYEERVWIVKD